MRHVLHTHTLRHSTFTSHQQTHFGVILPTDCVYQSMHLEDFITIQNRLKFEQQKCNKPSKPTFQNGMMVRPANNRQPTLTNNYSTCLKCKRLIFSSAITFLLLVMLFYRLVADRSKNMLPRHHLVSLTESDSRRSTPATRRTHLRQRY